jgi:hypothetical protein
VGILLCGLLRATLLAVVLLPRIPILEGQPPATPSTVPTPSPTPAVVLPASDVAGEDIATLPRFPGSVRSDYEVALDERYRLLVTEYLVDAPIDEVRAFYQGVIASQGWDRADIGFSDGEWSYSLVDGDSLALIEIEEAGGLVEIDLQISEPIAAPAPAPAPTDAPEPLPPTFDDDDD